MKKIGHEKVTEILPGHCDLFIQINNYYMLLLTYVYIYRFENIFIIMFMIIIILKWYIYT